MIDYIKISLPLKDYKEVFTRVQEYQIVQTYKLATEELGNVFKGSYKNMRIEINSVNIIVHGSLHKYYNLMTSHVEHNYDDFNYEKLEKAISMLSSKMRFKAADAVIQNMEFGVNVRLDRSPTTFLKSNLIIMKDREAKLTESFNEKGYFNEFSFNQFYMKVYDKGKQYELDQYLLRVEVKTRKSEIFTGGGGNTWALSDLLNTTILLTLRDTLIKRTEQLIICDDFNEEDFNELKDYHSMLKYVNPKYWSTLHESRGKAERKRYYRRRVRFKDLMESHGLNSLKKDLVKKVKEKSNDLIKTRSLEEVQNDINV